MAGLLRLGNAGSNTAADHIAVLDDALAQILAHLRQPDEHAKVRVLVRTDAASATHSCTARIQELGMQLSLGAYLHHFDIHTILCTFRG